MIAACLLPLLTPSLAYPAQVLVPLLERALAADDGVSSGRDERHRLTLFDNSITLLEVRLQKRGVDSYALRTVQVMLCGVAGQRPETGTGARYGGA